MFCRASLFAFSFLFAAVTNLLLGLLPVEKKILRKHPDGQFVPWSSHLWQEILLFVFHSKLLSIFVYMSIHDASFALVKGDDVIRGYTVDIQRV